LTVILARPLRKWQWLPHHQIYGRRLKPEFQRLSQSPSRREEGGEADGKQARSKADRGMGSCRTEAENDDIRRIRPNGNGTRNIAATDSPDDSRPADHGTFRQALPASDHGPERELFSELPKNRFQICAL
jgi:hypothetical protein